MSTLKISKHSDVPAALDLVREEVDKEARRIFSAGGDALKDGRIKPGWRGSEINSTVGNDTLMIGYGN